jgi:hypothetical protein
MKSRQFTGVAGVHFVASRLNFLCFHAVPTTRNVGGPDLLVSSPDGFQSLTIQVKTTRLALRTRGGRGKEKKPYELQWDVGPKSRKLNNPNLWFAFVDLKEFQGIPDIYFVPSKVVFAYFYHRSWSRFRYHPLLAEVERYKNENGWKRLKKALK